jgi:hypothetical protein
MNPLKERRIASTTKTITTLFICGSLLVGFMVMSLSFTQPAMAQRGPPQEPPQCSPGERFVPGEGCTKDVCPPETDVERDDKCFEIVEVELEKICPPETDREDPITGECFVEEEVDKVPGDCPASHPVPAPDNKCAERLNPAGNPAGQHIDRPQVCPPETDREDPITGECFVEEEVDPICPPETDRETDEGICIDEQEEELQKVPVSRQPGRGNA